MKCRRKECDNVETKELVFVQNVNERIKLKIQTKTKSRACIITLIKKST